MHSTIKVVDRKNDLRNLGDSLELKNAAENKASNIVEVDLSFNQLDNIEALDVFPNLKILLLDHNNLTSLQSFPSLPRLETLSLSYNGIRGQDNLLLSLSQKFPTLKNLNLMKNPVNPMFDSEEKYAEFRATVKIWIPTLQTLDGTDFSQNMDDIKKKQKEVEAQKS
jgi:Leucine-rich repeat (LRR) protein